MKVKDLMPKKEKLYNEFKNLQLLERLFKNNPELAEQIADKAGLNLPLDKLITEVRMTYFDVVDGIDKKILEAEIPD